jgi:hypothetical protein
VESNAECGNVFCASTSLPFIAWRVAFEAKGYGLKFVSMLSERCMCGTYVALRSQRESVAVRLSLWFAAMHRLVYICICIHYEYKHVYMYMFATVSLGVLDHWLRSSRRLVHRSFT